MIEKIQNCHLTNNFSLIELLESLLLDIEDKLVDNREWDNLNQDIWVSHFLPFSLIINYLIVNI